MKQPEQLARQNILNLSPYSSARDDYNGNRGIFLDANENPFGKLNRYPDPHHTKLRKKLSELKNIPVENIFTGNGSDEAIDLLFRIFSRPGTDRALTFVPTYGMYEVSAAINDTEIIKIPLTESFNIDYNRVKPYLSDERLKLIFICSPNNPTSNSIDRDTVIKLTKESNSIVVVDEAYIDFSSSESLLPLVGKYPNLVVLQTFSKARGAAGIRVGMAYAGKTVIDLMYKVKPPYNISTLSQKEALKRLEKPAKFRRQVSQILSERERLSVMLGKVGTVEKVWPSDANFLLVKVKDANRIYNILCKKHIIVRNRSSVIENCLRITVGTRKENNRLIKELKKISL
jgi:histidinol-phosphate aminotransferase